MFVTLTNHKTYIMAYPKKSTKKAPAKGAKKTPAAAKGKAGADAKDKGKKMPPWLNK
jgi:hypothetical protein